MLEVKFLMADCLFVLIKSFFLILGRALRLTFIKKQKGKKVHMPVLLAMKESCVQWLEEVEGTGGEKGNSTLGKKIR